MDMLMGASTGDGPSGGEAAKQFLTASETAEWVTVSIRSLQKMMAEGLPYYEPVPGRRVFRRDEVVRWLEERKRRIRGESRTCARRKIASPLVPEK